MTGRENVIQLDAHRKNDLWPLIEVMIRDIVDGRGHPGSVSDWVVKDIKERDFQLAYVSPRDFDSFPPEVRRHLAVACEDLRGVYGRVMVDWLAKIVLLEIDLFYAKQVQQR